MPGREFTGATGAVVTETWGWHQIMYHDAEEVTIKPRGHSMEPLVMDRQQVTIRKLTHKDVLKKGDIVLVKVEGRVYLHKVTAVSGNRIQVGNNHGWTTRDKVAGKLSE